MTGSLSKKATIRFIGCHPSDDALPAQFPENGGRAPLMLSWYAHEFKLSPRDTSILKEIVSYLNFKDFYTDYREIREEDLADGTGYSKSSVIRSVKSLKDLCLIETIKVSRNKNKYRLTRKIPDAYIDHFVKEMPHKFKTKRVVSEGHYSNSSSVSVTPPVVSERHYQKCQRDTTSCLTLMPENHPNLKNKQKEHSVLSESGGNPLTPAFSEKKNVVTMRSLYVAAETAIQEEQGKKYASKAEKRTAIDLMISENLDKKTIFDMLSWLIKNRQAVEPNISRLRDAYKYFAEYKNLSYKYDKNQTIDTIESRMTSFDD